MLSSSDIFVAISFCSCTSLFLQFSKLISSVCTFPCNSYFLSVFSDTFVLWFSISNSFSDNFSVIFFNSSSFFSNSFWNFSLFSFKLSLFCFFCSISSLKSFSFSFASSISFSYLLAFSLLFSILVFATLISEFNISISFWLSNPKFDISSIFVVISSITVFNSSLSCFVLSIFVSSSSHWLLNISSSFTICVKLSLYFSILYMNNPISMFFSSSLKFKYFFAFSELCFNGSILLSISDNISFILSRFNFVRSNFFSASCFLVLYFTIPAASSNIFLLSSDLLLKISSIFPCPIIEYPSLPIPVSMNNSNTSFNLHGTLFI